MDRHSSIFTSSNSSKCLCKIHFQTGSQLGRALFSMTGNQGNRWQYGSATVPTSTGSKGYYVSIPYQCFNWIFKSFNIRLFK